VRSVVNDSWGQVSLSGGPEDPKGQSGRAVRNLVGCCLLEICSCSNALVEFKRIATFIVEKKKRWIEEINFVLENQFI
jgi:hypothetical protein